MLTGCSPFAGDTIQETYLNVAQGKFKIIDHDFHITYHRYKLFKNAKVKFWTLKASLEFPEEDWCDRSKDAVHLIEALCVPQPKWVFSDCTYTILKKVLLYQSFHLIVLMTVITSSSSPPKPVSRLVGTKWQNFGKFKFFGSFRFDSKFFKLDSKSHPMWHRVCDIT